MTVILGISAYYHDSAAALVVDGKIVAAAQEERFTRKKNDADFPSQAIDYCLKEAAITQGDIDYVCFYDKPLLKFERLLETYISTAPKGFRSFATAMPIWLKQKLFLPSRIREGLGNAYKKRIIFCSHHESHAASAFFPSPFDKAATLTLDGVGEWATATFGRGEGNRIEILGEQRFPHSLGLLYSAFTYYCGFRVNSGEYKLMGLAPYGDPLYYDVILKEMLDLKPDGSFKMNMSYFNYCAGLTMTSPKFHKLFGGNPRKSEDKLTQRDMDVAASIQKVTEEVVLRIGRHVHKSTGMDSICLAGGVALNCVANGRLLREGPFKKIWIQPAAGDAGGALGCALFAWHQLLENKRIPQVGDSQSGSLLGPKWSEESIREILIRAGAVFVFIEDEKELCAKVAQMIANEKVVGWFQGRMEFGPRALGSRSILGDARSTKMQSVMNLKIKFRESFRPFAPSILADYATDYFDIPEGSESPYMLLVAPVKESKRLPSAEVMVKGLDKLKQARSIVPAITHVDYSARLQTVDGARHGRYHQLVKAFYEISGCPAIINTSFNVRGEPIVCRPEEALRCFLSTNIDVLVLERFVLLKEDQSNTKVNDKEEYLSRFELD